MNLSEKENMKIVGIFKHKGNYYMLLLNDRCNRYYLKIDNNTLCNVSLQEYIDINKTYFSPRIVKGNKTIQIEPLIRFKKKLITLSMAATIMASLAACGKTEAITSNPVNTTTETISEETIEEEIPEDIPFIETDLEKTIRELKSIGVIVEPISDDVDLYRIKGVDLRENVYQGIDFTLLEEAKYTNQCTPGEFNQYLDKKNITYDDVKEVIFNNPNIPDDIKEILLDGVSNLEEKNFNMDLSVLYYNMNRFKIRYVEPGYLGYCIGVYDHISGDMVLDKDIDKMPKDKIKEIIIHESIGHGSTRAYDEEQKLMVDIMDPYLEIDKQGVIRNAGFLGHFGVEGIADAITSVANDKLLDPATESYLTEVYELTTLCASNGLTVEDYANGGVQVLLDKMKENGIDNPIQLISVFDNVTEMMMSNALVQTDLTETFIDYYDELEDNNVDNLSESSLAYQDYLYTIAIGDTDPLVIKINDEDTMAWLNPSEITNSIEKTNSISK